MYFTVGPLEVKVGGCKKGQLFKALPYKVSRERRWVASVGVDRPNRPELDE